MAEFQVIPDRICCECMRRSPLFSVLTEEEVELVNRNKTTISFNTGEIIRKQGTHLTHVVSLNSGYAKVYMEGQNRPNTIIRIVKSTSFIGGPGIYFDQLHHYTIAALTDATICNIDVNVFRTLIDTNKRFAHLFLRDFSSNILSVYNRLVFLTQKHMPGRMADALFYLFEEVFESRTIHICLSKQDMADLSGMSKDSAVKVLREFQKTGIIDYTSEGIELRDEDALRRISRTG